LPGIGILGEAGLSLSSAWEAHSTALLSWAWIISKRCPTC